MDNYNTGLISTKYTTFFPLESEEKLGDGFRALPRCITHLSHPVQLHFLHRLILLETQEEQQT